MNRGARRCYIRYVAFVDKRHNRQPGVPDQLVHVFFVGHAPRRKESALAEQEHGAEVVCELDSPRGRVEVKAADLEI